MTIRHCLTLGLLVIAAGLAGCETTNGGTAAAGPAQPSATLSGVAAGTGGNRPSGSGTPRRRSSDDGLSGPSGVVMDDLNGLLPPR